MRSLTADPAAVTDALGRDPAHALLLPQLALDAPRWSGPFLLEHDGRRTLICRDMERGNVEALQPPTPVAYHTPYFLLRPPEGLDVTPDLRAAVAEHAGGGPVAADPSLPYGRLLELSELATPPATAAPVAEAAFVRRIDRGQATAAFGRHAQAAVAVARKVIAQRPGLEEALGSIEPLPDTRFERLDALLRAAGATAVLASSSINARELSGEATDPRALVLACRDDTGVHLIEPAASARGRGDAPSAAVAVKQLVGGPATLAIEERSLSAGQAIALREHGFELLPFSIALSRWRESRAHEELPCTLIAAQASRFAIEGTLAWLGATLERNGETTERRLSQVYLQLLAEFRERYAVPFAIEPYFTNLHTGERSLHPGLATDAPITASTASTKIDAGVLVHADGLLLGSSDVARTHGGTPAVREAISSFTGLIRDEVLPALRPGWSGADVHARVAAGLDALRPQLAAGGLHPGERWRAADGFDRNVGHLMSRQESLVTDFSRAAADQPLHDGAVIAVEIQWAIHDAGIACEDMALVTESGAVAISA